MEDADERASLLSTRSLHASPDTLTKLVKRIRALTLKLLPVEVSISSLAEPTSRIISLTVIQAYEDAAGDFLEALPYCLLRARQLFMWDASHDPADYGENRGRAIACEVLARRVVHRIASHRLNFVMSSRYRHLEWDGVSDLTSALELAIDTNCTIFLSSNEAQHVVNCLWRGDWIQENNDHGDIDYVPYDESRARTFWDHLDPSRLSVPRYQNFFRVTIWLLFLIVYSQAVREPLERLGVEHQRFDGWEIVLYTMALSFAIEDLHNLYKILRFFTWRAFSFWTFISLITDALMVTAFTLRIFGIEVLNDQESRWYHLRSFQVLSYVSPLIWMKLITIVDGFKWVGTMQICIARMFQESGIFFVLLSILGIGFMQGLYALDAADGETEHGGVVINALIQALLGSPDFTKPQTTGSSLLLFYLWNVATSIILLNVLISLFSSAYQDVVDDAEAQYLAFFAGKTIGMIRAPDTFVYPAPFNIIEAVIVAPWEPILSTKTYAKFNRRLMLALFFVPLLFIAFFETNLDSNSNVFVRNWFSASDEGEEENPAHQNPEVKDEGGKVISKFPFADIVSRFPDTTVSSEASLISEITRLRAELDNVLKAATGGGPQSPPS